MIETLNGIKETVNFKTNTTIRLYANDDCEAYPSHWHAPLEIIMPIENSYRVTCCKTLFTLREDDILIITPGAIHSMEAEKGKRLIFQADFTLLHGIKELEATLSIISPALLIIPEDKKEAHDKIKELLYEISEEYFNDMSLSEASIYAKLLEIFVRIGRSYSPNLNCFNSRLNKQREYTERFLYICSYISEHCGEDISLDKAAALSGFSKYHFSRLFKQFTNVSYYKYLNRKRIEAAEKLLADNELTITEVSLRCGFSSLSAFIRMFRLMKDCTPTEFKTMYTS
ncbi:helix-turn-helix domain-containing protein [Anaerocolumna sp. AGMB13020]|uniref:helix-turn-helix domain-containing protein n=1 Tax=Anaerocolumna sp. AGMB13020 TaxID=3081750 RepID=UPI002954CCC2|nr:helix-turn-helix domain-containing protein [Anaerocolumna sp. AGMB13020]WOO35692.1 helix-turn-helix domain-containing protein [Anaerocolumna sp. AGMB13020]